MFWKVALFSSNPTERGLMRAREAPAENATQPPLPIQHFVGADRTYAVVWYGVICSVSLALHVTFVIGTRRLCGWNSNFCFTLLFILSLACIIRFTTELIASLTALFYLDWIEYQALWIAFGSLAFAPYFTVVLLNFLITFHRLAYTAFPFKAAEYLNKSVLKVVLGLVFLCFLTFVIILNTDLLGARWTDTYMCFTLMKARNIELFRLLNTLSNYAIGCVNPLIYSLLFAVLIHRKIISFKRNREIKMTMQVLCMVICEVVVFLYWEFIAVQGYGAWDLVIAETSNILFFDVLVVPYLILNGNIHAQLRNIRKPHHKVIHVSISNSRVNVNI